MRLPSCHLELSSNKTGGTACHSHILRSQPSSHDARRMGRQMSTIYLATRVSRLKPTGLLPVGLCEEHCLPVQEVESPLKARCGYGRAQRAWKHVDEGKNYCIPCELFPDRPRIMSSNALSLALNSVFHAWNVFGTTERRRYKSNILVCLA